MIAIPEDMKPFEADGEYCVPIVDNRLEMGGYEDAWPHWFRNFYNHCSNLGFDYGQVLITVMNRELQPAGARLVQFDTQDGWMMAWRREQDYLMFVLKWA
jgi:hypothetical protein